MPTEYWILIAGAVAVVALSALLVVLVWRRRRPEIARVLRGAAIDSAYDVLVPNGMGGQIHIEHLLLTSKGVVIVDVKGYEGTIFGSDRMDEWTVMTRDKRRFTFPNPQDTLYDRIAAIRRLVRDIPVSGHVLFSSAADFTKGRPREVILAHEFVEEYRKPDKAELEQLKESYIPMWERIKESLEPANALQP
ncbi:MAG: NERD domain-containing protein [Gammaproteobacteria bacterium]|nr:NERD domain-containing protein [Gammaproteobacteria bacterium]